ncbi:MAG: thioredoxin family protein [Desulfosalsimonas sp.]
MKKKLTCATAAFICILLLGVGFVFSGSKSGEKASGIQWYSFEEGVEKIKKGDRKGFFHFYTDWCSYCKKMEKETFSDNEVISILNQDFVSIKINAEEQPGIAKQFGASGFPFNRFVDKENEQIGSQPGFIPPDMMINLLEYVSTDNYKKMRFDKFMEERE